jgi:hypothetical protein
MNYNPDTGTRFGVIALSSIDPDLANDELWYGPGARNLSEEEALNELRGEARRRFDAAMEDAEAGAEDKRLIDDERGDFVYDHVVKTLRRHHGMDIASAGHIACDNVEDYIDWVVERENDFQIDEPIIEGEYEGVKYRISWLGGAPLLWIIEGPVGFANSLCSPCVPGAADLDSGFEYTDIPVDEIHAQHDGYLCYVVPADWLRKEDE